MEAVRQPSNERHDDVTGVFFRGIYRYPRSVLIIGWVLPIACGWQLWEVAGMLWREGLPWNWQGVGIITFMTLVPGILGYAGIVLFYHAWRRTAWEVVVDRLGCTQTMHRRRPFRSWSDIASIGLTREKERLHPWINPRSKWASLRVLQTVAGMTPEEGEVLLDAIHREVAPEYPHLEVVGRG